MCLGSNLPAASSIARSLSSFPSRSSMSRSLGTSGSISIPFHEYIIFAKYYIPGGNKNGCGRGKKRENKKGKKSFRTLIFQEVGKGSVMINLHYIYPFFQVVISLQVRNSLLVSCTGAAYISPKFNL